MSEEEFNMLLLEAIDEGFSAIGQSSKQAIFYHLETGFGIRKQEVPEKVDEFANAIERIFGLGASFLEILIMKLLYEKTKLTVQLDSPKDFKFTTYVTSAKQSFLEKNESTEKTMEKLAHVH